MPSFPQDSVNIIPGCIREEKMEHEKLSLNIYIIRDRLTGSGDCYDRHFSTKVNNFHSALLTACVLRRALPLSQAHKPERTWHSCLFCPEQGRQIPYAALCTDVVTQALKSLVVWLPTYKQYGGGMSRTYTDKFKPLVFPD